MPSTRSSCATAMPPAPPSSAGPRWLRHIRGSYPPGLRCPLSCSQTKTWRRRTCRSGARSSSPSSVGSSGMPPPRSSASCSRAHRRRQRACQQSPPSRRRREGAVRGGRRSSSFTPRTPLFAISSSASPLPLPVCPPLGKQQQRQPVARQRAPSTSRRLGRPSAAHTRQHRCRRASPSGAGVPARRRAAWQPLPPPPGLTQPQLCFSGTCVPADAACEAARRQRCRLPGEAASRVAGSPLLARSGAAAPPRTSSASIEAPSAAAGGHSETWPSLADRLCLSPPLLTGPLAWRQGSRRAETVVRVLRPPPAARDARRPGAEASPPCGRREDARDPALAHHCALGQRFEGVPRQGNHAPLTPPPSPVYPLARPPLPLPTATPPRRHSSAHCCAGPQAPLPRASRRRRRLRPAPRTSSCPSSRTCAPTSSWRRPPCNTTRPAGSQLSQTRSPTRACFSAYSGARGTRASTRERRHEVGALRLSVARGPGLGWGASLVSRSLACRAVCAGEERGLAASTAIGLLEKSSFS